MLIDEIRKKFPQFADLPPEAIIDYVQQRYYPNEDKNAVSRAMGYEPTKIGRVAKGVAGTVESGITNFAKASEVLNKGLLKLNSVLLEEKYQEPEFLEYKQKIKVSNEEASTISSQIGSAFGSAGKYAGLALTGAGLPAMAVEIFGGVYGETEQTHPEWSETRRVTHALIRSIPEALLERWGTSQLLDPFLGVGKITLKQALTKTGMFFAVKQGAKNFTTEGVQEVSQQLVGNAIDKLYRVDRGLFDGVVSSFFLGGLVGGTFGVGAGVFNQQYIKSFQDRLKAVGMTDSEIKQIGDVMVKVVDKEIMDNPDNFKEALGILTKADPLNVSDDTKKLADNLLTKVNTLEEVENILNNMSQSDIEAVNARVESKETEETLYAYEEKKLEWIQQAMDRGESMEKAEAKIEGFSKGLEGLSKILGINKIDMAKLMIKDGKEQEKNKVTKGSYKVIDGTAILSLFEAKDDTTLMHEFAHHFFNIINTYKPEMLAPVLKEAKVKNLDGDNYIKAQEYFARSYEAYLRKGEAPTPELKSLFQKLSEWIREVYKNLSDMEVQLTPTMQKFFDDIYTASETKGKTEAEVKAQQDLELKQKEEEKKKIGLYYEELLKQPDQTLLEKTKASAQDLSKSASDWANKAFVPLSTRLKNINSKLKYVMRDFEFKSLQQHKNRVEQIKPFLEKFSELSEQDGKMLDYALKNSDMTMVYDIVEKNNMVDEFAKVREMLEQIYSEAESVKLDLGYLENYFPRRIENPDKFMTFMRGTEYWTRIEEQLKEVDPMNDMTQAERAEYISTMLRGFGGDKALLAKPSYTKDRQIIELTPEMNKYYKHSTQAIIDYVRAMSEIIEARKLFGKSEKEINKSIGAVVDKMIKDGDIGYENEKKAKEILISRFNQKGVSGIWSLYKDINYMTLLGSPISAITQIEDIALTMYKSGLFNTAQGLIQSITNKGITQTDLGIENISSEFQDKTLMKNAIEKLFKITGFSFMDKLGKESFINGVYLKYKQQAKKPNARFIEMLDNIFGEEATQVIDDLKGDILTDNIKYLMFNELAEIQPITISEMPEYYVKGGNLRLLYALKSFTIKRLDYLRNTVIDEIKADPIKGTANLVRLAMCLIVMGATTDFIKDFILGREVEPEEMLLNNIFKMFGFGKWMLYTARREGLGKAVVSQILPPTKLIDDIYKDIIKQKDLKDLRTISNIPVAGKFWYWWFGGGAK